VAAALLIGSTPAPAAYTAVETPPLSIQSVFQNEWGNAFVKMSAFVNSNCAGGVGLYLYNLEIAPVDDAVKERRKHKMAIARSAKTSGARVVIRYFHDPARAGNWDGCYIDSIEIVD